MSCSTTVHIHFLLNRYTTKHDVFHAIRKVTYIPGATNTADALFTLRTQVYNSANGDRREASNVVVMVVDGKSNFNSQRTLPEALLAQEAGNSVDLWRYVFSC